MKRFLVTSLVMLLFALPGFAQSTATPPGGYYISCNAVTTTGPCSYFSLPMYNGYTLPSSFTVTTQITGSPSAVSTTFEGSVDGRTTLDVVTTASSTTITSKTMKFTQADVGKTIYIGGAAAAGATQVTTLASVTNATTAVLNAAATNSMPQGAPALLGTFYVIATLTNTAGEEYALVNFTQRFIRCNVGTLTNGSSPTVTCGAAVKGE